MLSFESVAVTHSKVAGRVCTAWQTIAFIKLVTVPPQLSLPLRYLPYTSSAVISSDQRR